MAISASISSASTVARIRSRAPSTGVRVRPAGAEHRAAAGQQAPDRLDVERHDVGVDRAAPAVAEADEVVTVDLDALAHDAPG